MLYTLSSPTADVAGFVELDVYPDTVSGDTGRRVSRIATLDGGVTVIDGGFTVGDSNLELTWPPKSKAYEDNIIRMVATYQELNVGTPSGVLLAVPETYKPGADKSSLRLLVIRKVSS